jgi:hypothetical protein
MKAIQLIFISLPLKVEAGRDRGKGAQAGKRGGVSKAPL